jgi:hypothetical protein
VRHKDNPISYPPPCIVISHRFVAVGGVTVFYKERFYSRVKLVGNCHEIVYKALNVRRKDLC